MAFSSLLLAHLSSEVLSGGIDCCGKSGYGGEKKNVLPL
jgi:hypothetical protein